MKRKCNILVFSIMLIAMFLLPMTAQATPDPRLWHWIGSDDEIGFFVSTRKPTRYSTGVKQWVMQVRPDDSYDILLQGFRWNNGKENTLLKITLYTNKGKMIDSVDFSMGWSEVIPGSYDDAIWDYVSSQVSRM